MISHLLICWVFFLYLSIISHPQSNLLWFSTPLTLCWNSFLVNAKVCKGHKSFAITNFTSNPISSIWHWVLEDRGWRKHEWKWEFKYFLLIKPLSSRTILFIPNSLNFAHWHQIYTVSDEKYFLSHSNHCIFMPTPDSITLLYLFQLLHALQKTQFPPVSWQFWTITIPMHSFY